MRGLFFALLLAVLSFGLFAQTDLVLDKALKDTGIKKKNVGIAVYDIASGKLVYSINEDKFFSIASVNKLLITALSLKYLGQDFRFKTTISGSRPSTDGDVKGDIYIKGSGDPIFVSENMWYLVNMLCNTGVKSISGDIFLDDSLFPARNIYEENGDRAYNAKVSALSVNFNSIAVNVVSGQNHSVSIDPPVSSMKLIDKTESTNANANTEIRRVGDDIVVSGRVSGKDYGIKTTYRNIDDPISYFEEVLRLHLSWRGIKFTGKVKVGKTPSSSKIIFEMDSRRLNDILVEMNKFSNNFIAEQIMRALVYKVSGSANNDEELQNIVNKYLKETGVDSKSFEVVNASGFSKMNKTKPSDFVKFLSNVYGDFQISPEFVNSLPISGVDGTIRRSLGASSIKGKIRAKTGTLSGVRSIAGYVAGKRNVYSFIIVVNDPAAYNMINWEGKILETIVER